MSAADLDQLRDWDRAHVWHPFTALADWEAADPLVIERGEGVYLIDTEGNRYLDGVSSLWCNVHGHRHPRLDAALLDQVGRLAHATLLGTTNPAAIELARQLVEVAPPGLTRVFYSDDGATAVEVALKMAFQYWRQKEQPEPGRNRFVALGNAYHGDTLGDVSVGGVERFHAMFAPLLFPALRIPSPHPYRCGLCRDGGCTKGCLDSAARVLAEHRGQVAAVIVEPLVQGAAGMVVHPTGYLAGLRALCDEHDTLLIADEVAVGFGRTGTLFACEQEGVTPDFLCVAKGITGGYMPLAATLTTEAIASAFRGTAADAKTFMHGHTYAGNPLGCALGLANLAIFRDERTLDRLQPKIEHLARRLAELAALPQVGDARQRGFMAGIELVADRATKAPFPWADQVGARVCRHARTLGVLLRPLGDVIVVLPPLSITIEQLDALIDAIAASIAAVLPTPALEPTP